MPALLASMQSVTSKIKYIFFITICSLLFHLFRILAHILFCVYICEWLLDWCDVWIIWKTLHFVPSSFISQINLISLFCTRTHALLSYLYSQINNRAVRSYFPFGNWKNFFFFDVKKMRRIKSFFYYYKYFIARNMTCCVYTIYFIKLSDFMEMGKELKVIMMWL